MNQQELTKLLVDSYKQAPPFIQRFISSGALSKFVEQTREKYKLHIDVAGRLSDEITMLMLGISDPKEFFQNLANEAILPEESLKPIVEEINQKIFVPLREEMRKGVGSAPQPVKPPASSASWRTTQGTARASVPMPNYAPPPVAGLPRVSQPERSVAPPALVYHLQRAPEPEPRPPAPHPSPKASEGTARENVQPLNTVIIPANPRMPQSPPQITVTMPKYNPPGKYFHLQNKIPLPSSPKPAGIPVRPMSSSKLLEDHEEPHIEFHKAPLNVPRSGTSGEHSAPQNVLAAKPPPSPPRVVSPLPPAKPYSSDPYREPIDEK